MSVVVGFMQSLDSLEQLTPLQRAIYETDLLGVSLRESTRIVSARMGFFVGQHKYMEERVKIARILAAQGTADAEDTSAA
jgi:hypothetical protein